MYDVIIQCRSVCIIMSLRMQLSVFIALPSLSCIIKEHENGLLKYPIFVAYV